MGNVLLQSCILIIIMILGYIAKKVGLFDKGDYRILNRLVMYFTLPCVIARHCALLADRGAEPDLYGQDKGGYGAGGICQFPFHRAEYDHYDGAHDVSGVIGKRKERVGLCRRNIFIL